MGGGSANFFIAVEVCVCCCSDFAAVLSLSLCCQFCCANQEVNGLDACCPLRLCAGNAKILLALLDCDGQNTLRFNFLWFPLPCLSIHRILTHDRLSGRHVGKSWLSHLGPQHAVCQRWTLMDNVGGP